MRYHPRTKKRPVAPLRYNDEDQHYSTLTDHRSANIGLLIVFEDLTNLIEAQRIAAWREVARRLAHEIKNPLTPIQLSMERIVKQFRSKHKDFDRTLEEAN